MSEDTNTSPHVDKSFNDSPCMDQGVNELPQTNHDDIEDGAQFEDWPSEDDHKHSYWMKDYAGHVWDDNRGWLVLKPGSPSEPWWIEDPLPRSPSDLDYLCDVCRHINFCWLFENNMHEWRFHLKREIGVGTVGRILKQANCSFCALLAPSCRGDWSEDETVHIGSRCFSDTLQLDCNHPETEVKYLSIGRPVPKINIQVLDDSRPMRGRQISRYINQQQQNIAKQWLEKCEHEHCINEDADLVPNLALIDLDQRCIVRPHGPVRYAALSYVWGKRPQKMYTMSTKRRFETKGALHSNQGFLPQTITDAMDLAAHIGLDYLWVDSLCILQDDEADRNYFIGRMGSIYGNSAITIVDANGNHADSGLVGMSSPRRNSQKTATVQGMQLCTTASLLNEPWKAYRRCAWLKRGWTYQEMLLSKRLLLVTHAQLQFVCNHSVYLEETHPHAPRTSNWTMPAANSVSIRRSDAAGRPISDLYFNAVETFTSRVLTDDLDVIPAFDAIFKALYKDTVAKPLFNLPDVELEDTLLWRSNSIDGLSMERTARRRQPDRLPTWSWAGWRGTISYDRMAYAPLISVISWRSAPKPAVGEYSELMLQDYRCAIWRDKGWKSRFLPDENSYAYHHCSRPDVFFRNPIALEPHAELSKPLSLDDSNVLYFSAFTVRTFRFQTRDSSRSHDEVLSFNAKRGRLYDLNKYLAGSVILDCLPVNNAMVRLIAFARCSEEGVEKCAQHLGADLRNQAPLDWDRRYFDNISEPVSTAKRETKGYGSLKHWDPRRFQDKFYPLYIALLVEIKKGIAYRIGIAKVHIDAFHAANPTWGEVRLG